MNKLENDNGVKMLWGVICMLSCMLRFHVFSRDEPTISRLALEFFK